MIKTIVEEYFRKDETMHAAFMDLEKACDRVDWEALWNALKMYGVGSTVVGRSKSLYMAASACVRMDEEHTESFPIRVVLRQGCVMLPLLFNILMDGCVREMKA